MNICFVCHANICRSFSAQQLLKKFLREKNRMDINVFSRGIYAQSYFAVPSKITDFLKKEGIEYCGHQAALLCREDMQKADLVLVMTEDQLDYILDKYAEFSDKVFLILDYAYGEEKDLEDPISQSGRAFEKTMEKLKRAVKAVADKLAAA